MHIHTDLNIWEGSRVAWDDPDPLTIYDINGQPLFYEFTIMKKSQEIGKIKTAASKVLGSSIITIEICPLVSDREQKLECWVDFKISEDFTQQIKSIIEEEYPKTKIKSMDRQVCYNYPNIGLLIILIDPKTKAIKDKVIIDNSTLELIQMDDHSIWSIYDTINESDRQNNITKWELDDKLVQFLKQTCKINGSDFRKQGTLDGKFIQIVEDKLNIKDFLRTKSLNVEFLWTGIRDDDDDDDDYDDDSIGSGYRNDYSVPRSLAMIFKYNGILAPWEIAIDDFCRTYDKYNVNEIEEYWPLVRGQIDKTPTFEEIVIEIDNERPVLKAFDASDLNENITQPGSVVCGYTEYDFAGINDDLDMKTTSTSRRVRILDPNLRRRDGWLQPYERWESWDLYNLTPGKSVVNVYIVKPDLEPKITLARLKSMKNPNVIRKYLKENRPHLLREIGTTRLIKASYTGSKTVKQLNFLFDFLFRFLDHEEIFRYLKSVDLGVYIDDELHGSFEVGFYREICELIMEYHHTELARRCLERRIYHLFPYFLEIKGKDEEIRKVLLTIKDGWISLVRDVDPDGKKAVKRIFGKEFFGY